LDQALSHNLLGQRLGRKGRVTRERILAATDRLLADPSGTPLSLSAVAREASLGMTSLYLYFGDLVELVLAVLEPIMESAEESYLARVRVRWPDAAVGQNALAFVSAYHAFWEKHSRILHLRNTNDMLDARIVRNRIESAQPLIDLLTFQMDGDDAPVGSFRQGMASALVTGLERIATVTTDMELTSLFERGSPNVPNLLRGQARLLELGIVDGRGRRD
jgi:AcrR family transcriptional regulator